MVSVENFRHTPSNYTCSHSGEASSDLLLLACIVEEEFEKVQHKWPGGRTRLSELPQDPLQQQYSIYKQTAG
ncbi:hypothetical protein L596_022464 [Steinernema carpocapsae]|uniref:Uncharacterized protein n=1 Tax=Steinernema carpocapsae TaxID=34508 RepID=A0A4U5MLV6_STECR|nr:hypothetical protein L596_022464 [Steinernema carpocapsae]